MSVQLAGRHVLITGGGRGIGRSIALACQRAGAKVTVLARSEADLAEVTAELRKIRSENPAFTEASGLALRADVTKPKDLSLAYAEALKQHGPVFGLICAAGVYGAIGPFQQIDIEEWARTIEVNLTGTARSIHMALPLMTRPEGGRIVLFSGGGQGPMPNFSDYVTSKGAIWRLTETLGAELALRKIFVNAVAPGAVNTKLLDDLLEAGPERVGKDVYEKSVQQRESGGQSPEKAAELCLYLLSEKSAGLFGKTISAVWDPYTRFENLEQMSRSDLFCYRRVVDAKGNTRA